MMVVQVVYKFSKMPIIILRNIMGLIKLKRSFKVSSKNKMEKKLFKLLTRYFFIGILAAFIELSSFSLFIKHINYIIANSLAFCLAVITSFVLNRVFNFKVHDKTIIRFGRFLIVNISGLCISNFILFYF